jgi:ribosomal-protein-serine acetyltransferase
MLSPSFTLTNGRIILRPQKQDDAEALAKAVQESVPALGRYLPWARPGYGVADALMFIEGAIILRANEVSYEFLITDAKTGSILGGCGLDRFDTANKTCNLGYWVKTDAQCQGTATEAAALLIKFGFEQLKLNRIEIIAEITNVASQRVAEKVGAVREGVMRKRIILRGEARDAVLFAVVR